MIDSTLHLDKEATTILEIGLEQWLRGLLVCIGWNKGNMLRLFKNIFESSTITMFGVNQFTNDITEQIDLLTRPTRALVSFFTSQTVQQPNN